MSILLPKPSRDDPGQAFMHLRKEHDKHLILRKSLLLYGLYGKLNPLEREILSAVIQFLQVPCNGHRLHQILGGKELKRARCRIQPSRRVQARPENESQMISRKRLWINGADLHQRAKAKIP